MIMMPIRIIQFQRFKKIRKQSSHWRVLRKKDLFELQSLLFLTPLLPQKHNKNAAVLDEQVQFFKKFTCFCAHNLFFFFTVKKQFAEIRRFYHSKSETKKTYFLRYKLRNKHKKMKARGNALHTSLIKQCSAENQQQPSLKTYRHHFFVPPIGETIAVDGLRRIKPLPQNELPNDCFLNY